MKVSVCIATYNGEKYIREQLASILPQLSDQDEIIISDDHSTDNTLRTIRTLKDPRIKIIQHRPENGLPTHMRATKNFENALKSCSGELILLADQDDIWNGNKLERIKQSIHDCDLVTTNASLINSKNQSLNTSFYKNKSPITGLLGKLYRVRYHGCTLAFTRELLDKALPFPSKLPVHDAWLGLIAEITGKVKYINEELICYRIHESNLSRNSNNSLTFKINYRIRLFQELYSRFRDQNPEKSLVSFITRLQTNSSTSNR